MIRRILTVNGQDSFLLSARICMTHLVDISVNVVDIFEKVVDISVNVVDIIEKVVDIIENPPK